MLTMNLIKVKMLPKLYPSTHIDEEIPIENKSESVKTSQFVQMLTSVLAPIDYEQPDVNREFEESKNSNKIFAKVQTIL